MKEILLSIDQIRNIYPEQWVLIGNPILDNETNQL